MALTPLQRIVKRITSVFSHFREKTAVEIEDFELEHFLLYHGLIGSSPEGQRAFRDVRADFMSAVKNKSSLQMGITLKLMPLFWEDKLKSIAAEVKDTQKDSIIACLMPDNRDGMLAPNQNPPFAEDWRVRANAATLIAYVGAPNATDVLTNSLNDTAGSARSAFCHTVLALAAIKTPAALSAIEPYMFADEPWFRVDSINAISHWPFDTVAEILADGLNSINNLSDYAAVSTARNHKPEKFLTDKRPSVQNGGMAMILALCSPDHKAFSPDQLLPFDLGNCLEHVLKLNKEKSSALRIRTALFLVDWLTANRLSMNTLDKSTPDIKTLEDAKNSLLSEESGRVIEERFAQHEWKKSPRDIVKDLEGICLIALTGEFKLQGQIAKLEELAAQESFLYADAAIEALGKIGVSTCGEKLIQIANRLVNKKARCSKALSAQPVVEESPQKSLTYWHILSALGNLKTDASFEFLLGAVSDHAPDKREKALSSLISVGKELSLAADKKAAMHEFLIEAFKDPSNLVKQTAIESAGILNDAALIEEVAAMAQAKEPSLWKEAHRTLKSMAQNGHKEQVCAAVKKRIESTGDAGRRERLTKLANELN
ncbi:MAG: hypothetical protein IT343_14735 [Candidatus Melainabacteria bacterium]|jgi:HEAT repeat protein|nr:hypothetical protein [Candidatus Melainabacteria bacterium]